MVSSLNVTFNFVFMLTGHWPFGNVYCKMSSFISIISVCGSVFTLVAIAADRYNAIIRPLKPRMGRPMTILVAIGIWLVAMTIAVPQLLYFRTIGANDPLLNPGSLDPFDLSVPNITDGMSGNMSSAPSLEDLLDATGGNRTSNTSGEEWPIYTRSDDEPIMCMANWPDGMTGKSDIEFWYNVCFMILTYFLPMSIITATYATIARELWGQQAIGAVPTAVQIETIKSKRRIVKMMMTLVVIFGVCWLPYHIYFILSYTNPQINHSRYIQEIYLSIYWLAMSNSMYNPMIYCVMNNRFRQGFLRVFNFFCPCTNACICSPCCRQGGDAGDGVTRGGDGMEGNGHTMACAASATAINHYGLTNCVPLKELGPHLTANNGNGVNNRKNCPGQWNNRSNHHLKDRRVSRDTLCTHRTSLDSNRLISGPDRQIGSRHLDRISPPGTSQQTKLGTSPTPSPSTMNGRASRETLHMTMSLDDAMNKAPNTTPSPGVQGSKQDQHKDLPSSQEPTPMSAVPMNGKAVAIDQDAVPQSNLDVSEVDVSSPLKECVNPVPSSAASQKPTKEESTVPSQPTDEPVTKKRSKLEAQDSQELVIVYKVGGPIITQDAAQKPETSLVPATRLTQQATLDSTVEKTSILVRSEYMSSEADSIDQQTFL